MNCNLHAQTLFMFTTCRFTHETGFARQFLHNYTTGDFWVCFLIDFKCHRETSTSKSRFIAVIWSTIYRCSRFTNVFVSLRTHTFTIGEERKFRKISSVYDAIWSISATCANRLCCRVDVSGFSQLSHCQSFKCLQKTAKILFLRPHTPITIFYCIVFFCASLSLSVTRPELWFWERNLKKREMIFFRNLVEMQFYIYKILRNFRGGHSQIHSFEGISSFINRFFWEIRRRMKLFRRLDDLNILNSQKINFTLTENGKFSILTSRDQLG